jgi:hypothetical protein
MITSFLWFCIFFPAADYNLLCFTYCKQRLQRRTFNSKSSPLPHLLPSFSLLSTPTTTISVTTSFSSLSAKDTKTIQKTVKVTIENVIFLVQSASGMGSCCYIE